MYSQIRDTQRATQVRPQTILIVEDESEIRDLLLTLFNQETPYRAYAVSDASQAVEAATIMTPSLFILDYGLPGMNGLALHDLLHSIKGLETIPTLMISAHFPSREAMQQRHITYLTKPLDFDILLSVIANLLAPQRR